MSYILDALKKSERERTLVRGLGFGDAGRRLPYRANRMLWWLAGFATLALALIVTVLWWWKSHAPASTPPVGAEALAASVKEVEKAAEPVAISSNTSVTQVSAPPAPSLVPATGEAKYFSAMPPEFQSSVPAMTVNIHVYADTESARILYINNRQYRRGDDVGGGVLVEEIVPDGAVLQFRGQRFKLPRPS